MKTAIFASGNGSNLEALAEAGKNGRLKAEPVVCICDRREAPVIGRCRRLGLPVIVALRENFDSKDSFEEWIAAQLESYGIELICLAGYMRIIGKRLLDRYKGRIINIHPSLLPSYKGAHALHDALTAGETEFGVSVHFVDETIDGGPLILQEKFRYEGKSLEELEILAHRVEHRVYPQAVNRVVDSLSGKRVLVVGSGGRCHAIVEALSRSPRVEKIFCAPGNPGISLMAECVPIQVSDVERLADFALEIGVDLTFVGPEAPLYKGIADEFAGRGLKILAPSREAARIEESKLFAKQIMARAGVATADYRAFSDYDQAMEYVRGHKLPVVVKFDGPAAGKGTVVAHTYEEAERALLRMLRDRVFGEGPVLVEDFLPGREFSVFCFVNGRKVWPIGVARDYKRAYEGDRGPNTGGMGAYSPVGDISTEMEREVVERIIKPVAAKMDEDGVPFRGILYGGLVSTEEGPKVLEFNARFGDPETEVLLPRLESDFYTFAEAVLEGREFTARWSGDVCVGIVLAAEGYPEPFARGIGIDIPEHLESMVFHMGTAKDNGKLITAGGRVLMVVGRGENRDAARKKALRAAEEIKREGLFYRKDIG